MTDTQLPTAEQALGKSPLPTAEDALGPDPSKTRGVFSGALSDAYFAAGAPNRILHSFSQAASQSWGAIQDDLSPETSAYRSGLPKEYHEGRTNALKAANESWMRSAAHGIWDTANNVARVVNYTLTNPRDSLIGLVSGIAQGIPGAIEGTAQELGHTGDYLDKAPVVGKALGAPLHAAGELTSGVAQGAFIPESPHIAQLDRGRSVGSTGEPEGKYFGTVDLTARDHTARAEALSKTIDSPETPKDVHQAARQYAPEAFESYDILQDHRRVFQDQLAKAEEEHQNSPEYKKTQSDINDILESVNHDESELSDDKASQLSQLRDKLEVDPPAVADARQTLKSVEGRITDLSPHIQDAYQLADAGNKELYPQGDSRNEPAALTVSPERPAKSASELAEGEIAKDVESKLVKAGRPADEAKIAGILYQQRYDNRVARSPHLGTAEDLYKKEGPDIIKGKEGSDNKDALNQLTSREAVRLKELQNIRPSDQMEKEKAEEAFLVGRKVNLEPAPTFYSALTKNVSDLTLDKAHPQDWLGLIDNLKGVKKEEVNWSGIKNWLGQQYRDGVKSVSKEDVLQHLRNNEVQIHEVNKSDFVEENPRQQELLQKVQALYAKEGREGLSSEEHRELSASQEELDQLIINKKPTEPTKYSQYTLPGGKNYKELLLTKGGETSSDYTTSHWNEKNILAHVRFDERTGPNGEKILHVAEIQSDWHQQGRKKGYFSDEDGFDKRRVAHKAENNLDDARNAAARELGFGSFDSLYRQFDTAYNEHEQAQLPETQKELQRLEHAFDSVETNETVRQAKYEFMEARSALRGVGIGVPDAPFKTSWHELALKRMIRYAAEDGFDKLSWDTGQTSVDRYNLEKHVKLLTAEKHGPEDIFVQAWDHQNHDIISKSVKNEEELASLVGKDVAQKLIEKMESGAEENISGLGHPVARLSGEGLKVGGAGMKGFYDKLLPDAANKIGKKFGSKVGQTEIDATHPNSEWVAEGDEGPVANEPKKETVHSLDITPEMKQSVLEKGQSLFQQKKGSLSLGDPKNTIKLFRAADASTFFHETGHQWLEELTKDANHEQASPELKADLKATRDFLKNDGSPWTRSQHEKFARSIERYFREGHAPTKELAVVFQRFKEWLTAIYKTLRDLPNSKIDDSIRDVFDRLIVPERNRDVVAPEELEQRGTARQRERDLHAHIEDIKEQARSRQIFKYMDEARERVKSEQSKKSPGKAPEKDVPEPTPVESESGTADIMSDPREKGQPENPNAELKITSGPLVDNAGNIRVENLTSDQDLADSIKLAYDVNKDDLDKSRGKINSQATIDLAEAGGIKTKDVNMKALIKAAESGGIPLSSYISILRNAFLESAKNLKGVMAGEDEVAYAEASTRHMALSRHLMGITAEWGRAGHSFRSLAEEARQAQELNEFMQMSLGKTLKQLKTEMKLGRYLDTPKKVSGFVQDMSKSGYGEWILEMYKNWLISGPITHMTYWVGNQIFAVNRLLEATARVGISALREDHPAGSHLGEVKERAYGLMSGQLDGLRAGYDSFKAGETALLPGEERATTAFTQHSTIPDFKIGKVSLPLGSAVRLPSERLVAPLHSFARSVAFMEERNGLIYRRAVLDGLTGDALERRIAELKNNVPVDITVAARAAASEAALMGRSGEFTRKTVAWLNSEVHFPNWAGGTWRPGGFIAPFVTVSSNINRLALLERSPLGIFSKNVRDDISGVNGRFKQDVAISKMAVGTSIGITAGTLYAMNVANPAAPEDFKHAAVDQAVNGLPHSIRIGEMSYDLSRLGILGTVFSNAVDIAAFTKKGIYEAYEKGDPHLTEDAAVTWYHSMVEHLETEGFLSGISDLMKAVNDPDRYGQSWAKGFISSLIVPYSVGMNQIAQRIDPYQRDTRGVSTLDSISRAIRAKIPFESETLEAKVDLFGQPIPQKEYWGVYATRMSQDPVWTALKDIGYFPAPVKRTINGVKLTPEQYHDFAVKAGVTTKMLLDNVIQMPGFSELDANTKHELIKDAVTSGRQSAAEITKAESFGTENDIVRQASETKDKIGNPE